MRGTQATKSKTASPAKPEPNKGKAAPEGADAANGEDSSAKSSVPEVANVLEFVAWLVGSGRAATAPQTAWLNGRGGFLADELPAVREASIRIQVSPSQARKGGREEGCIQVGPSQEGGREEGCIG